jgi:hypothetical protein
VYFAAMIGPVQRQHSRLECDERYGMRGMHRTAEYAAGVGGNPARQIQRKHRCSGAVDRIRQVGPSAVDVTLQADTEQAVYDQIPMRVHRYLRKRVAAGIAPRGKSDRGIGR